MSIAALRALFEQALELPPAARAAFLDTHCADPDLRARVQRMLDADADGTDSLAQTSAQALAVAIGEAGPAPILQPGMRVGAFELGTRLGEGGYATVFRAHRDNAGVRQDVALKLLHRSLHSLDAQRQFRRERHALAQLQHPNIARLIEGGISDAGLAYIALELVEGVPITMFAHDASLGLRARLVLFVQVCRAVAAAHRALIVHRDLKPSNVLVTADGQSKLLDFGIAKILEDDRDDTRTQLPAFTPAYAAPEQVAGGAITTATDVYALGVLLGELLTGQRFDTRTGRTPSAQVHESDTRTVLPMSAHLLRRALRGDLDRVLAKALAADPEQRYASAGAFADDIERHLAGQPVAAHPPSRWYRTRKFVRRHRGGVATTFAFVLAIVAALGLALWQADIARREAARANTVRDFLVSVFDAARASLPRDQRPTPDTLVTQARQRLATSPAIDAATRADLLRTLGEVELSLSNLDRAEASFAEASSLLDGGGDPDAARTLRVLHADARQRAAHNDEAIRVIEPQLAALRTPPSPTLLRALSVLAAAKLAIGKPDDAIAHLREAAAAADALHGADDADALAATFALGTGLSTAQRYRDAIAVLAPALERWRTTHAPEDDRYVAALTDLAVATDGIGDEPDSEARFRELLALKQRIYTPPHASLVTTLRDLGTLVVRRGRIDEGLALFGEALAMQHTLSGEDSEPVASIHGVLGTTYAAQLRYTDADAEYRAALAICARIALKSEICTRARNNLGQSLYRQGRLDEARAQMSQALDERRAAFGPDHPTVAYSLGTLANVAAAQNDHAAAVQMASDAIAILERADLGSTRDAALIRNGYASALHGAGRDAEALRALDRSLADWTHGATAPNARQAMMLVLKAQILQDLHRDAEARAMAESAAALQIPAGQLSARTKAVLRDLTGNAELYQESDETTPPR